MAGSLVHPTSAGNVTYFKPGTVSPYVQGNIQHDGSGLSLSAGGTEVELTDFEIDPGTSKLYGNVAVNNEPAVDHAFLFQLDGSTPSRACSSASPRSPSTPSRTLLAPMSATNQMYASIISLLAGAHLPETALRSAKAEGTRNRWTPVPR